MQRRSRKSWVTSRDAASVEEAIAEADTVVFAVWLDTIKELAAKDADLLKDKVVVDPSNPIGMDESGQMTRTLPENQSAGSVRCRDASGRCALREGIRHARRRLARKRREP